MGTIPASEFVQITPGVIGAGGTGLAMVGLLLDNGSTRVPVGPPLSFPSQIAVADYFGLSSAQASAAAVYFNGFDNSNIKPAAMLVAQFNQGAVSAYIRGGNISSMTLQQLQALNGELDVVMDGYSYTAPGLTLAGANSFSAAASLIASGLNASPPAGANFTGSVASEASSFTASIAGTIMTVSSVASGQIVVGEKLSGTAIGVAAGTIVLAQLSGTGGVGTYVVSPSQVVSQGAITGSWGLLTVSAVSSGTLAIGQLFGAGLQTGQITAQLSGSAGLVGTYAVGNSGAQTLPTSSRAPSLTATYDSVSGAFVITSGSTGATSTAAFATNTLAASLLLTQQTGAVLSQGAAPAQPIPFMETIVQETQNWVSFWNLNDPDGGGGNGLKQQFAQWVNSSGNRYLYAAADTDITPTESTDAATSLGQILKSTDSSGTAPIYEPTPLHGASFLCGAIASIDFTETNGRATAAFKSQTGLTPGVTNQTVYENLKANGYNCYAAVATAAQNFEFFAPGSVSGPFDWIDSYIDQIWLNNALQLALMELLTTVKSIPYNPAGYALIRAACMDPITAALNFGAIRPNVPLSIAQAAEVNNAAGTKIDNILSTQGWFLQIQPATAQVRAARASPPINLWYMDGQSVQQIALNSTEVE